MSEAITRAERHARRESAMEPGVGYCRECKRSWPCLYEQGQRDERERIRTGVTGLNWAMLSHDAVLAVIDATPCETCNGNGATGPADDPDTCQACRGRGER